MATTMHASDVAELLSEGRTHFNLSPAVLVEHAIRRNEAEARGQWRNRRLHQPNWPVAER